LAITSNLGTGFNLHLFLKEIFMTKWHLSVFIAGALLIGAAGCDRETGKTTGSGGSSGSGSSSAGSAADTAKQAASEAKDAAGDAAKSAGAAVGDAATMAQEQGSKWIDQLQQSIKDNKLDQAQTYVTQIEKIKDKLPATLRQKYDSLRASFDTLKAKAGALAPGAGGENK
jgi:hypothetical protein